MQKVTWGAIKLVIYWKKKYSDLWSLPRWFSAKQIQEESKKEKKKKEEKQNVALIVANSECLLYCGGGWRGQQTTISNIDACLENISQLEMNSSACRHN